jgi:hypothetical protein
MLLTSLCTSKLKFSEKSKIDTIESLGKDFTHALNYLSSHPTTKCCTLGLKNQ